MGKFSKISIVLQNFFNRRKENISYLLRIFMLQCYLKNQITIIFILTKVKFLYSNFIHALFLIMLL